MRYITSTSLDVEILQLAGVHKGGERGVLNAIPYTHLTPRYHVLLIHIIRYVLRVKVCGRAKVLFMRVWLGCKHTWI